MKPRYLKPMRTAAIGLLASTLAGQAAELIPATGMTAEARFSYALREPGKVLNGLTDGGGFTNDGTISVTGGGDPNNPADYRNDASAGSNTNFGQRVNWSGNAAADQWIRVDLGADYVLDSMAFFNLTVSTGPNTIRGVNQADIYYRTEASGAGSNTSDDGAAFDNTGWTLLGTAGEQTFTQGLAGDVAGGTSQAPDVISFGAVTARYVAFDINSAIDGGNVGIGELLFFKDSVTPDPLLVVDEGSAVPDFAYGSVFATTSTPSRTVTYTNSSVSMTETITIDSVTVTDDAGGVFGTPVVSYSGTNVLSHGDTVSIEIPVSPVGTGAVEGNLEILTTTTTGSGQAADANNKNFPLTATIIADGEQLNPNPFFESDLANWDLPGSDDAVRVSPGLAGGSNFMVRVPGIGDPSATGIGDIAKRASFMQSNQVLDGASNWEFSAFFTPINISNFASYVDADGVLEVSGADGAFTDRTFQLVIRATDTGRPFPDFADSSVPNTLINIAYMPAGIQGDSTPDFYVFDGTSGQWVATGIGAIIGSTDNDTDGDPLNGTGDGLLDTSVDPLDEVNAYRILVTGNGFGTPGATYDISVSKFSGTDPFTSGTATGLSVFHGISGDTGTPAGYSFITSDTSVNGSAPFGSNIGDGADPGFQPPFWVDDVSYFNGTAPDPNLSVLNAPKFISFEAPATSGTSSFVIRNDGTATNLNIDASSTAGGATGFSISSPSLPFSLAPGATQEIVVEWDSTSASSTYEADMLIISDTVNALSAEITVAGGVAVPVEGKALANGDFETPGDDPSTGGNTDSFADWDDFVGTTDPSLILDVPGLITGVGSTAAYVGPPGAMRQFTSPTLTNFVYELDFAIKGSGRQFNTFVMSNGSPTNTDINIRYQAGLWYVFQDLPGVGTGWVQVLNMTDSPLTPSEDNNGDNSLEDAGDVKVTYKLRMTGVGWGTALPEYSFEILDSSSTVLASTGPLQIWRHNVPTNGFAGLTDITYSATFGSNTGFWVDNVSLTGQVVDTIPPATTITLTDPVFNPGAPNTVDANIAADGKVDIYRSTTGMPGGWGTAVASGVLPGNGVQIDADASPAAALYIAVSAGSPAP